MSTHELIKTLIDFVSEYEKTKHSGPLDVQGFSIWLHAYLETEKTKSKGALDLSAFSMDAELAAYLGRLNRYANSYIKTALINLPFTTDMDFAFTAILHQSGPLGKAELIRKMVYEKSSGMEIIKRLLRLGLLEQHPNPMDKRSKLLNLTKKGEEAICKAYDEVGLAAKVVGSPLTNKEKLQLLRFVKKLDDFHEKIYLEGETDLNNILGKGP